MSRLLYLIKCIPCTVIIYTDSYGQLPNSAQPYTSHTPHLHKDSDHQWRFMQCFHKKVLILIVILRAYSVLIISWIITNKMQKYDKSCKDAINSKTWLLHTHVQRGSTEDLYNIINTVTRLGCHQWVWNMIIILCWIVARKHLVW